MIIARRTLVAGLLGAAIRGHWAGASAALAGDITGEQKQGENAEDIAAQLADVKAQARLITPRLDGAGSQLQVAMLLRDQVHRATVPGGTGLPELLQADYDDFGSAYRKAVLQRSNASACNGKSILLMIALRAFEIPSRIVMLYTGQNDFDRALGAHASVDVFADGRWIAMDPSFNIALAAPGGELLSWIDAVDLWRRGERVETPAGGMIALKGQTLAEYEQIFSTTLAGHAGHVLIGPSPISRAKSLSPDWDGVITYREQPPFDAWASITSDFFQRIAMG